MTAPDYRVLVAYTRTGQVVDAIDQPTWSFDENLAWAELGKMDITVPLPGRDRAGQNTRSTLRAIGTGMSSISLVLVRDDVALWAGPVYTLGWDDQSVKIGCATLGKLLDRRVVLANGYWATPADAAADLTLALPSRDLAIELLDQASTGPRRDLPLSLPAQSGSVGPEVTYKGVDLRTAYEAIKDVVEADGGPDVVLQPQLSADQSQLSWAAAVGAPALGGATDEAEWDYPMVVAVGDIDDSETVDTAYVVGDSGGSDSSQRLIGVSVRDRDDPWPALERADRTSVSESRQAQLDALAESYGEQYELPVEAITYTAPADLAPLYRTSFNLGDVATFNFTGHPWLDDGQTTARILGVSMDATTLKFVTTKVVA